MKKVAAIVVTFNRKQYLVKNIESLLKQTKSQELDIFIIDNASTDGTYEELVCQQLVNKVHYVNTGSNIGGAGGFNFGIKYVSRMQYEYVWLMDDDCFPYSDSLEQLLVSSKELKGKYGWLASVVLWRDNIECRMNRPKLSKYIFDSINMLQFGLLRVQQASFVSLFIRVDVIKKVGLPIKDFFIWGDDVEYTRRIAIRNNYKCYLVGKSRVLHCMSTNSGSNIAIDVRDRIPRYKLAFRNEFFLYKKEGVNGLLYYIAKCFWHFIQILYKAKDCRVTRIITLIQGIAKGAFFNPKIEYISNDLDDK